MNSADGGADDPLKGLLDQASMTAAFGDTDENRVCGLCGRVLAKHGIVGGEDDGHEQWMHLLVDLPEQGDHEPLPVEVNRHARIRCDFCFDEIAWDDAWVLPVRDFADPTDPSHNYRGNWSACTGCVSLIRKKQWQRLVERVMKRSPSLSTLRGAEASVGRTHLTNLFELVRRHSTGRPYEVFPRRFRK